MVLPVKDSPSLPQLVADAVALLVDSLEALDLVILLAGEPDRSWTAEEIAERLRIPILTARREIDRAHARGLTEVVAVSPARHQFAPVDDACSSAVAQLVDFHATRRIDLINHVASRALARLRSTVGRPRRKNGG